MSRYLTPSKIGLLGVIYVYCDGDVPTSATIPVLSFLISHLLPLRPLEGSSESVQLTASHVIPIFEFQKVLSIHASAIPGRTLWDLLLKKLWSIDCSDSLHQFFETLPSLLAKTREEQKTDHDNGILPAKNSMLLSRSSPLGAFVRRAQVEFTRLQFHDAVELWKNFIVYKYPTRHAWGKRNSSAVAGERSIDVNLAELEVDETSRISAVVYGDLGREGDRSDVTSTHDVERLLEFQVGEMQRLGGRIPEDMRTTFRQMLNSRITTPSLSHYVKFLDSWRAGDYPSSFDNLHRYFDYTLQNRERFFYQYALLNLAILQADFGCYSEAIAAMQEAISTAREHKDMNCLNFCLSWLYHFGKAFPNETHEINKTGMLGSEKEGLAFLKAKAKESEMWSLLSTSLLSEAKLGLQNGESIAIVFENIVKASHLSVTKNVTNITGSLLMMQSSVFSRLGVSHLSWSYAEVFLTCYEDEALMEDVLKSNCWMAHMLAQKGRYKEAMARMETVGAETLRTLKYTQYWTYASGLLKLRRLLFRDNLNAASHILKKLSTNDLPDSEISLMLALLKIEFHIRSGDYSKALSDVESTAASSIAVDIYARVKLLNIKARILEKTNQSPKAFSITMRAASLAFRARLLPALWESITALAVVLISLSEFSAAIQILEAIVPQVLECEDCELTARAYSALLDASMGLAGETRSEQKQSPTASPTFDVISPKTKMFMTKAVEYLDAAFVEYERLEDVKGMCDCMAKKATIMHLLGELVLANDCSSMYLNIKERAKAERE